jgi:hypothetical protein
VTATPWSAPAGLQLNRTKVKAKSRRSKSFWSIQIDMAPEPPKVEPETRNSDDQESSW